MRNSPIVEECAICASPFSGQKKRSTRAYYLRSPVNWLLQSKQNTKGTLRLTCLNGFGNNMVFIGVDPASATGAVGVLDSQGNYIECFMIEHQDKHIRAMVLKNALLRAAPAHEGGEIAIEMLYSRPGQSASAMWTFARAVGAITAICELTNMPCHMVRPQVWKKFYHIHDKDDSLDIARMFWPEAPLKRKKDNNLAEALLIGDYWRQQVMGLRSGKTD